MLFTSLFLIAVIPTVSGLSCFCPKPSSCEMPTNCKGGLVPDACHCCQVCAKIEGEPCGGLWNTEGTCDTGLKCVIINKMLNSGHCQRVESLCEKKKCGFRQQCATNKHGKAVCICPRNCRESKPSPVCGYKNGKQYKNPCELHRHECRSGREIGLFNGPCKKCYHHGKAYRLKEARRGHAPCEKCVCHHGDWLCKTKKHCQDTLDFCTLFNDPSTGLVTSTCPEGFWCKVQIPSIPEQNIPGVGKCVSKEVTVTNSSIAPSSKNASTTAVTKTAKVVLTVCELPPETGSCLASISRWYFNKNRRKCVKFTFGGCDGNANNFRTKSSCRNMCMRRKGHSSKASNATQPTMSTSSKRNTKLARTPKTTAKSRNMTATCQLPPAPGPCRAAMPQWYYNTRRQRCSRFIYGGCGGNDNNFDSKDECKAACMRNKGSKLTHPTEPVARLSSESHPTSPVTRNSTRRPTLASVKKDETTSTQRTSTNPTLSTSGPTQKTTKAKTKLRGRKAFRCPCTECKWQTGKDTCRTRYGCFTSQVERADGRQTISHGCLENEEHYTLLCNVRTPDERHPKMVLECCKGHMCNFNDVLANHPAEQGTRGRTDVLRTLPKRKRSPTTTTQTATLKKQSYSEKQSPAEKPRCYDGHSKTFFGETEEWKPNECTVCTCRGGQPACVATVCRHPRCLDPIRIKGQCCPVCNKHGNITEDSQEMIKALAESHLTTVLVRIKKNKDQRLCEDLNTGELYISGQNWKVDDCTTCYCQRDGKIACAVQMCSGYPGCRNPVKEKGQCCPVCKEDIDEELTYPENEVVDSPHSCLDPVTGDYYKRSEMWQQDDCTACICGADRKYQCRKTTCKHLTCAKTIKLKGRCCPACASDTKTGCSFEGQKYLQGEYKLLADHCTLCECRNSEWICSSRCWKQDKPAL